MNLHSKSLLVYLLLSIAAYSSALNAEILTVSWQGTITSVTSFKDGAVPVGVIQGALISGSAVFDKNRFASSSSILSNVYGGTIYRYPQNLQQTVRVGALEWAISGGNVVLTSTFLNSQTPWFPPDQGFSVDTTDISTSISFPKSVGGINCGFYLVDDLNPLELYTSGDLESAQFDFSQAIKGNGSLSSQYFDPTSGDITDGYFFTFDILSVSSVTSPSPISISARSSPAWKGYVSGAGEFPLNAWRKVVAHPRKGRKFVKWTENGRFVSSNPTLRFNNTRPRVLVAHFR